MTEESRQDPITLADLIRLESGLDARESTRLADAWVEEIRTEIGTSGISFIKGLGTFTTSGDGLRFELDSDFPVVYDLPELEGFVGETQSVDLEPSDHQTVSSEERLSKEAIVPADEANDEANDEASNESSYVTTVDTVDDTLDANDSTTEAAPAQVPATPDTAPDTAPDTTPDTAADTPSETVCDAEADPSPAPPSTSPARPVHRDRRPQRASSKLAGWVALALLLVVSGAVVFSLVQGDDADSVAITSSPTEPAEPSSEETAGPTPEEARAELLDDKDVSEETNPMTEIPIVEAPHAMIPGSTEDVVEETRVSISQGMGGYTLIIGSALRQERVESLLASYDALGWPQGILRYESDAGTRYRAAVGHFSTAALADSARTRFASDFPEGTWVLSVR